MRELAQFLITLLKLAEALFIVAIWVAFAILSLAIGLLFSAPVLAILVLAYKLAEITLR